MTIASKFLSTLLASACLNVTALSVPATAQEQARVEFDISPQPLDAALRQIAQAAGVEIVFSADDVRDVSVPRLAGSMTLKAALEAALADTDLVADWKAGTILVRKRREGSANEAGDQSNHITITGSHIRGATTASYLTVLSQDEMRNNGQTSLGDVARSLPQNFSGGQNPGVGTNTGAPTNTNANGASTLNLRGLGPDATLTLLNGHRMSYDAGFQGVDISAIPFTAVERLEVVSDGASAMYGSDAVGGVANVILRRDYDGAIATARLGAATDGGYEQQQYSLVAGKSYATGGFMLAYDYERSTAINAGDRSFTRSLDDSTTLYPAQRRHAALLTAHQQLGESIELGLDALFSDRRSEKNIASAKGTSYQITGYHYEPKVRHFTITPSIRAEVSDDWNASASFTYGEDRSQLLGGYNSNGTRRWTAIRCYCNSLVNAEAGLEGRLLTLPAGDVRLAVGGGYRANRMKYHGTTDGVPDTGAFKAKSESYFGYGELYVPILSDAQNLSFARSLTATAALRYENYPGLDKVATPKLGLIFSPTDGFELKGSWGRSFKAATLYQQNLQSEAYLFGTASYGSLYPSGSTVMYTSGGNRDLKPERAESWSVSLRIAPPQIDGLRLDLSYYSLDYRDRAVQPILSLTRMLTNPTYQRLIDFDPSDDLLAATIAASPEGLLNYSGTTYDPAGVVALVDNRYRNVASQKVRGIDTALRYSFEAGRGDRITLDASGTYIESEQRISADEPVSDLAGTIFNPPHFRGRATVTWSRDNVTLAPSLSYIGGVVDSRTSTHVRVDGQSSLNFTGRIKLQSTSGAFKGVELIFDASNILNDKPDITVMSNSTETPFDSTNYSAIGRFVSFSISKAF